MLTKKELMWLAIAMFVLALSFSQMKTAGLFWYSLIGIFFVMIINITAKKIIGFYFDAEVETDIWKVQRFGFMPNRYLKNPIYAGLFFPIIFSALSFGKLVWMNPFIFEIKPKIYRAAKHHGLYSFTEATEEHMAFIAAAGVFANIFFAGVGYILGFELFTRLSIYYAFFNIIPVSDLDGNKMFFGNKIIWSLMSAIVLIALASIFLVI